MGTLLVEEEEMDTPFEEEEETDTPFEEPEEVDENSIKQTRCHSLMSIFQETPNWTCTYTIIRCRLMYPEQHKKIKEQELKIKELQKRNSWKDKQEVIKELKLLDRLYKSFMSANTIMAELLQEDCNRRQTMHLLKILLLLLGHIILYGLNTTIACKKKGRMKYRYEKAVILIVWRCGDVEKNPGPPQCDTLRAFCKKMISELDIIYWKCTGRKELSKANYKEMPNGWNTADFWFGDPSKKGCTKDKRISMLNGLVDVCRSQRVEVPGEWIQLIEQYKRLTNMKREEIDEKELKDLQTWVGMRQHNDIVKKERKLRVLQVRDQPAAITDLCDICEETLRHLSPEEVQIAKSRIDKIFSENISTEGNGFIATLPVVRNSHEEGNTVGDNNQEKTGTLPQQAVSQPLSCTSDTDNITNRVIPENLPENNLVENITNCLTNDDTSLPQVDSQNLRDNGNTGEHEIFKRKFEELTGEATGPSPAKRQSCFSEQDVSQNHCAGTEVGIGLVDTLDDGDDSSQSTMNLPNAADDQENSRMLDEFFNKDLNIDIFSII